MWCHSCPGLSFCLSRTGTKATLRPSSSDLPLVYPEAFLPSIYLRELHSGLVEGEALDAGQREVLFTEQLCEWNGQGAQCYVCRQGQCGPGQLTPGCSNAQSREGPGCAPSLPQGASSPSPLGSPSTKPGLSNACPVIQVLF